MEIFDRIIPARRRRLAGSGRAPQLHLTVGARTLHFATPEAFEFAVAPRVNLPSGRLSRLMALSPDALAEEAAHARAAQARLVRALERCADDTGGLRQVVGEVGLRAFSGDHGWRDLMAALLEQPAGMAAYQRVALAAYARYLGERVAQCEILRQARHQAGEDGLVSMSPEVLETREPVHASALIASSAGCPPERMERFERLPHGRPVRLRVLPGEDALWLRLAEHHFRLLLGDRPRLVDPQGHELPLSTGAALVIGRHVGCDVVVDAHYTSLSRRHLSLKVDRDAQVVARDLSAHGTFVPRGCIEPLD